jgi:hypothetical protein
MTRTKQQAQDETTATAVASKATKKAPGKALQKQPDAPSALAMQDALDVFAQDGASYAPQFSTEDRAINFLRIAQSMTPQAKKLDPAYIKGCEEGSFFTSISRRVMEGVRFLPVYWTKNFTWWKPRNDGGGLVKNFGTDKIASRIMDAQRNPENGKLEVRDPATTGVRVVEVVEADLYFGFILHADGSTEECVLSLTSTQLPKARKWNSVIHALRHPRTGQPLPLFARTYDLSTVAEQNDKGAWAGLVVEPGPMLPDAVQRWDAVYAAAKALADDCTRGVRVAVVDAEVTVVQQTAQEEDDDAEDYHVEDDADTLV